ncbi:alpha amylase family protein [Rufibacter roseus]|uniref:Alpha amylase family protein n=1 Tax=Rufibacter roseus TaxID=1567108 RepID=A0ABW2DL21_9BACT|nr:alpha amylase family protein [Rufibacter roseus]
MMMFNKIKYFLLASCLFLAACESSPEEEVTPKPEPEVPVEEKDKEVLVWIEARANIFGTYGKFNKTETILEVLDSLQNVGVTGMVVDVKGINGYTIYPSTIARQLTTLEGRTLPQEVDYLDYLITEGHKRNLKVYASVGVFVEGDNYRKLGKVFDDPTFKNVYQNIVCDVNGNRVPITSTGANGFVNPARPEVQAYEQSIVKEVVSRYNIDGIMLDYCRYNDINGDFSDFSKEKFIEFLEQKFQDNMAKAMVFPTDIVSSWRTTSGQVVPASTGKYYKKWLMFRAKTIYDFVKSTKEEVKKIKPNIKFGAYVGSWYTSYYQVGVNWASKTYDPFNDPTIRFDWAYPGYNDYGYGDELDLLMTGNYFKYVKLADVPSATNQYHWWSIEGSLNAGKYLTKGKVPLLGSIDMGNVTWDKKEDITRAIQHIIQNSDGIMLFDVCHVYAPQWNQFKEPLWEEIKEGIGKK